MKRSLLIIPFLIFSGPLAAEPLPQSRPAADAAQYLRVAQAFDCKRKYCKAMRSCAEACYKFRECGHKRLDGDKDGIPCENVCKKRC